MARSHAKLAVFRADASATIGSGHVRRCLAVAAALRRDGWTCRFAVGADSLAIVPELATSAFEVSTLVGASMRDSESLSRSMPDGCELAVVDHYDLDHAYETAIRRFARRVLVIDDLADRDHDCDVLVDGAVGRSASDYSARVPRDAALLLGPAYAPLRPAFAASRARHTTYRRDARRLLVNFGGTDPGNMTGAILSALSGTRLPAHCHVDVVLGRGARHAARVTRQIAEMPESFRLLVDVPDMDALLAGADVAIGACGVSALERCCLGVPSVILAIADNQRLLASALAEKGAASLAPDPAEAVEQAVALLEDPVARHVMSAAAAMLCDGRGAARIATWIDPEQARDGRPVRLRPVAADDESMILAWQRQPETRRYARNARAPTTAEHQAWFIAKRADPDCLFNVVLHGSEPAGTVRLDRRSAGWEISIAIDTAHHRTGIGRAALALARRLVPEAPLLAEILPGNEASLALFTHAGYSKEGAWYVRKPH